MRVLLCGINEGDQKTGCDNKEKRVIEKKKRGANQGAHRLHVSLIAAITAM